MERRLIGILISFTVSSAFIVNPVLSAWGMIKEVEEASSWIPLEKEGSLYGTVEQKIFKFESSQPVESDWNFPKAGLGLEGEWGFTSSLLTQSDGLEKEKREEFPKGTLYDLLTQGWDCETLPGSLEAVDCKLCIWEKKRKNPSCLFLLKKFGNSVSHSTVHLLFEEKKERREDLSPLYSFHRLKVSLPYEIIKLRNQRPSLKLMGEAYTVQAMGMVSFLFVAPFLFLLYFEIMAYLNGEDSLLNYWASPLTGALGTLLTVGSGIGCHAFSRGQKNIDKYDRLTSKIKELEKKIEKEKRRRKM
jgi:hypothetical protein